MLKFRSSPFEDLVLRATDEKNVDEDWSLIMEICDKTINYEEGPRLCLQAITKRLHHNVPRVVVQALMLLDTCVKNCGKRFLLEVSSRNFVAEITKLLSKMNVTTADKLKQLLRRWAENEFKDDAELGLIPSLYYKLKSEGVSFPSETEQEPKKQSSFPANPDAVSSQEEEEEIIKAIELSLKETSKSNTSFKESAGDVTDSTSPSTEPVKVRALYDFEAAEDNELTVKAGEIVLVLDKSNDSWWKGSNHRGEGYFPSNFVTENLDAEPEVLNSANDDEEQTVPKEIEPSSVEEPVIVIDEEKIQETLDLLNGTDPTCEEPDSEEMLKLEKECAAMVPLIEEKLQQIDKKFSVLSTVNKQLMEALEMFYSLDSTVVNPWASCNLYKQNSALPAEQSTSNSQPSASETPAKTDSQPAVSSAYPSISLVKQVVMQPQQPQSPCSSQSDQPSNPIIWYHPALNSLPSHGWGHPVPVQAVPFKTQQFAGPACTFYAPVMSPSSGPETITCSVNKDLTGQVAGDGTISVPYVQVASHFTDSISLSSVNTVESVHPTHVIPQSVIQVGVSPQLLQPLYTSSRETVPVSATTAVTKSMTCSVSGNPAAETTVTAAASSQNIYSHLPTSGASGSSVDAAFSKTIEVCDMPQVPATPVSTVPVSSGEMNSRSGSTPATTVSHTLQPAQSL